MAAYAALAEALQVPGIRRGAADVEAPTTWSLAAFSGRLSEISGSRSTSALTLTFRLVYEAQRSREPVAWIGGQESTFYPPDVAASGVDLEALAVVRVQNGLQIARVADHLVRSGAFGLIVLDLTQKGTGGSTKFRRAASGGTRSGRRRARGAGSQSLSLPVQTRLVGLAAKHGAALVCLTEKEPQQPSIGSLVSLRAQAERVERVGDRYRCRVEILKDKRRGPGWQYGELCRAPDGLR